MVGVPERADRAEQTTTPQISRATTTDGVEIAYSLIGTGPPLVYVRGLNSHVGRARESISIRSYQYFQALEQRFTVLRFDARGNGASGPAASIGIDELVEDVRTVVADAGLSRFTLYGQGFGSPAAIAYAAQAPDEVHRLLLYCAHATGLPITDLFVETMRTKPGQARMIMAHDTNPDDDVISARQARELNTDPATAAEYFEFVRSVDVSDRLDGVLCPTLVMHPDHSPVIPRHFGEEIARRIPDSRLVMIPGGAYNPWGERSFEPTLVAIGEFIGESIPLMPVPRKLAVLVTDIVGSTAMTHRVGEEVARRLLRTHDTIVNRSLSEHDGEKVKHTGDGIMARFVSAHAALECAIEIQRTVRETDLGEPNEPLSIRIGIAHGDVIEEKNDLFGTTVVLAVRLTEQAPGGAVVVSQSVRDATRDAFAFGTVRRVELKGFPDAVPVYDARSD